MNGSDSNRKTILFSGHDLRFIHPFVEHCTGDVRYRVLLDQHQGHEITDDEKCRELLPAADIIFCEWCLGNAVWYSHNKMPRQKLLVRLHLQELRLPYLNRIQWDNVDALILICPLNLKQIRERYPFLKNKTHLIYNPIDCRTLNQPKLPGAEFNLGIMGISPSRKAPHLAVEIFTRLKHIDHRYTLFVKGRHPRDYDWLWRRPEERAYYEKLYTEIEQSPYGNSIVFETYGDDVPLWFSKIGFILSTSDFEGSHQSVAEGMASGAIPIIRNWDGAFQLYPPKYGFSNIDQAVEAVLKWKTQHAYQGETDFCRAYAREHFDQGGIFSQIEALWTQEVSHRSAKVPVTIPPTPTATPPVMILGYLPAGFKGGYRIRVEQEIKALLKQGCKVQLACLHPDNSPFSTLADHRAELEALGCQVHLVPIQGFFDVGLNEAAVHASLEELLRLAEENDLRIIHAEALYCARIGLLLKQRRPGLRLVFDCHGASPEEERLAGAHPARILAMEEWERRILASADLNIFVSEAMSEFYLMRYGFQELPHRVVPCGVADERFPDKKASTALALPAKRPILAYLGTLAAWQCGDEMIRLFAQLHRHDSQVFFLLLIPQADHAKARDLMTKYHLPEDATVLAELPHDRVAAALQRAHAGVLLRRAHPVNQVSSPTKFGEYLAAGLPVIMTDGIGDFSRFGSANSVALILKAGLLDVAVCPAGEISRMVKFVRDSRRRHSQRAARCRAIAREHLSWEAASQTLLDVYGRILGAAQDDARHRRKL